MTKQEKRRRIFGWSMIILFCCFGAAILSILLYWGLSGTVGLTWYEASIYLILGGVYMLILTGLRYYTDIPKKPLILIAQFTGLRYGIAISLINTTLKCNRIAYIFYDEFYPRLWWTQTQSDLLSWRSLVIVLIILGFLFAFWVVYNIKAWLITALYKTVDFFFTVHDCILIIRDRLKK